MSASFDSHPLLGGDGHAGVVRGTGNVGVHAHGIPAFRTELHQVGTITSRAATAVYPPGKKGTNRFMLADDAGSIASLQMVKGGVPEVSWTTHMHGAHVSALAIGQPDKAGLATILVATGTSIATLDKLGKKTGEFSTNSTEALQFLCASNGYVWAAGEYVATLFDMSGKEQAYFVSPDKILCMATQPLTTDPMPDVVIGCADRCIRVVKGKEVMAMVPVEGPVTSLLVSNLAGPGFASKNFIFYGTQNGYVGLLLWNSNASVTALWSFATSPTEAGAYAALSSASARSTSDTGPGALVGGSEVNALAMCNCLNVTPLPDLYVARGDGAVEVYSITFSAPSAAGAADAAQASTIQVEPPRLLQCARFGDSVRSMSVGYLHSASACAVVGVTLTGRVFSLSQSEPSAADAEKGTLGSLFGRAKGAAATKSELHVAALQKDLEDLRKRLAKEREKAAKSGAPISASSLTSAGAHYPLAKHTVISNFVLDPTDACYCWALEIPTPIDCIIIQSSVPIDLIEPTEGADALTSGAAAAAAGADPSDASTRVLGTVSTASPTSRLASALLASTKAEDASTTVSGVDVGVSAASMLLASCQALTAVISKTVVDPASGVRFLATVRCLDTTNRVQLRLRTTEGAAGELQALVVCRATPKSAAAVRATIAPLSLHHRLLDAPATIEKTLDSVWSDFAAASGEEARRRVAKTPPPPDAFPWGKLTITGGFTLPQIHEWVAGCLAGVPPRYASDGRDSASFSFVNVFTGTHLLVTYEKGNAVFKSDSPSTLFVLKQILTAQATNVKVRVSTNVDIPTYACRHIMNMLHVKLSYLLSLRSKAELVDAVREMVSGEAGDLSFLHPFLQDILQNGDHYRKQLQLLTRVLQITSHVAEDAFVSYFKLRGRDVSDKLDALRTLLLSYHEARETVVSFMESGGIVAPA